MRGGGDEEDKRKEEETLSKQVPDSDSETDNLILSPPEPDMLIHAFNFNRQEPRRKRTRRGDEGGVGRD